MLMTGNIRVLVFKEGDLWVAQCLEYDIGAQARDLDALNIRLCAAVKAEAAESLERNGEMFKGIPPAPQMFHDMWERRPRSVEVVRTPHRHSVPANVNLAPTPLPSFDYAIA